MNIVLSRQAILKEMGLTLNQETLTLQILITHDFLKFIV